MASPNVLNAPGFQMVHGAAIADPTGGTPDVEGRAAVVSMLAAMRNANLLAGGTVTKAPTVLDASRFELVHGAAIANPTGGTVIDANARTAINAQLQALRDGGVIAGTPKPTGPAVTDPVDRTLKYGAAIANVTGGATVDTQLRAAVDAISAVLRSANFIAQ